MALSLWPDKHPVSMVAKNTIVSTEKMVSFVQTDVCRHL